MSAPPSDPSSDAPLPDTLLYLEASAAGSFQREEQEQEAIWRSLPFFAAVLGLAATSMEHLANAIPGSDGIWATLAYTLLGGAILSFAWAFRWFWSTVLTRDYQYPAPEWELQAYAADLTAFYAGQGLAFDALDRAVVRDLRAFRMTEFSDAAERNAANNRKKLLARGQAMAFTLTGFALAFLCSGLIFVADRSLPPDGSTGGKVVERSGSAGRPRHAATQAQAARPPFRGEGREAVEAQHDASDMDRAGQMSANQKPPASKPPPPLPQIVKRTEQPVTPKKL